LIDRAFLKRIPKFNMGKTSPESNGIIAGVYFVFFLLEEYILSKNAGTIFLHKRDRYGRDREVNK
jgi:hypothetical protein